MDGGAQSAPATRTGIIAAVWDGGPDLSLPQLVLVERTGTATPLAVSAEVLARVGGAGRIDRQEVTVEVDAAPTPQAVPPARDVAALRVRSLRPANPSSVRAQLAPAPSSGAARSIGSLVAPATPFVTLLCRFADTPANAVPRREVVAKMYEPAYPAARHFFAEQAFGTDVLAGSSVAPDWVTIGPRVTYVPNPQSFDAFRAATDCTNAAEAAGVRVRGYFGINFQFSAALSRRSTFPFDPLSLGGTYIRRTGAADTTELFGATWLSSEHVSQYVVVEHEMGHALGWPHSEFVSGGEYDSEWDVMSVGYIGSSPEFGSVPSGTIAVNKQRRGWISEAATAAPAFGSARTAVLRALARPWPGAADTSVYMARLGMAGSDCEYTVEARRLTGYDKVLHGEGVLIHQPCHVRPRLIGPPGATDGGAGAAWQPGRMLADSVGGAYVAVDSATATGYAVTLTRGWPLTVRVVAAAGGSAGTVTAAGVTCSLRCTVAASTRWQQVTAVASPAAGAMFLGWEGECTSTATSCTVAMGGHRSVAARFGAAVSISSLAARPAAMVGIEYADTVRATGGTGEYVWSVTSGSLPPGIALDTATGVVRGTPTEAGSTQFVVTAASLASTATATLTLRVLRAPTVASDSLRPSGVRGVAYADTLRLDGDSGQATWAITDGALPEGLTLDPATGRIAGTPTATSITRFTAAGTVVGVSASRAFVVRIRRPTVVASDSVRRAAVVGLAYADTLRTDGEPVAVHWWLASGALPAGLALDSLSGVVHGVPTTPTSARFTVRAASEVSSDTRTLLLTVIESLRIASDSVRRGATVGDLYADTLRLEGGQQTARWLVVNGALPPGLSLAGDSGVVRGIPEHAGTFRYTVEAAGALTDRRTFLLTVAAPIVAAADVLDQLLGVSTRLTPAHVTYLDLLGNRNGRLDVGDVRAWLVATGALPAPASLADVVPALGRASIAPPSSPVKARRSVPPPTPDVQ